MSKKILFILLLASGICLGIYFYAKPRLLIAGGYAAKYSCSCKYISGYNEDVIWEHLNFSFVRLFRVQYNEVTKKTSASLPGGLFERRAEFIDGRGCILVEPEKDAISKTKMLDISTMSSIGVPDIIKWPELKEIEFVKAEYLNKVKEYAFQKEFNTSSLIVIQNDTVILEAYDRYSGHEAPLIGWSMTKSVMNTLIGILVEENKINVKAFPVFEEWKMDERNSITLSSLLNMNSGLKWEENYNDLSNVTKMLYLKKDIGAYVLDRVAEYPPESKFVYSSGNSNLLSLYIKKYLNDENEYSNYPYEKLFNKIGMTSAIFETDETGLWVGSSYLFASPRDWARFGTLYLHKGKWGGQKLFSEDWFNYTIKEAAHSSGTYGAHFWLNINQSTFPAVPEDVFWAAGYNGQRVFVIPSHKMVIVRLGQRDTIDFNQLIKLILSV